MIIWYDRQGKPIPDTDLGTSDPRWMEAMKKVNELLGDKDYKVVKQEYTKNKWFWVSTVWLGIDHSFSLDIDEPNPNPIIFETMVFDKRPEKQVIYEELNQTFSPEMTQRRYHTEQEALVGHKALITRYNLMEGTMKLFGKDK